MILGKLAGQLFNTFARKATRFGLFAEFVEQSGFAFLATYKRLTFARPPQSV